MRNLPEPGCIDAASKPLSHPLGAQLPFRYYYPTISNIFVNCRVIYETKEAYALSILEEVLEEEYTRSVRLCHHMERELNSLPKGSIRTRKINNHEYYYLNYREGDKVRSDYLRADEVEEIRTKINRRHELVAALKEQQRSQKQIEKALGRVPNVE